jgi:hypothetical protein
LSTWRARSNSRRTAVVLSSEHRPIDPRSGATADGTPPLLARHPLRERRAGHACRAGRRAWWATSGRTICCWWPAAPGIDFALTFYRGLRNRYDGSASYDFSENALNVAAAGLARMNQRPAALALQKEHLLNV